MQKRACLIAIMALSISGLSRTAGATESLAELSDVDLASDVFEPRACTAATTPTTTEITNACSIATSGPFQNLAPGGLDSSAYFYPDIAYSFKLGLRSAIGTQFTYEGTLYTKPSVSGYYTVYRKGLSGSYTYRVNSFEQQQPATIACSTTLSQCSAIASATTLYMTAGYWYYIKFGPITTSSSTAPTVKVLLRAKTASLNGAAGGK
ncbi:hypothetical protein [Stigmatella hybrida]|uniref:hypothetical protein n=1 Tax=Stigmatella hybrida TaxID=394097 RepID=UPI001CDACA65|nr:hypothetical protein [Stigmatella hybrida]